jgi:hypothetical protein
VLLGVWLDIRKLVWTREDWIWAWLELKEGCSLPACGTMANRGTSEAVKLPGNRLAHALRYPEPMELEHQRLQPGGSAPFTASQNTQVAG